MHSVSGDRTAHFRGMPNDIGVQSVQPVSIGRAGAETRAAPYFQPPVAKQPVSAPAIANPSLRLDPALGLVILQFHSDTGAPTTSIPSERQLEAYQRWTQTGIGTSARPLPARALLVIPKPPLAVIPRQPAAPLPVMPFRPARPLPSLPLARLMAVPRPTLPRAECPSRWPEQRRRTEARRRPAADPRHLHKKRLNVKESRSRRGCRCRRCRRQGCRSVWAGAVGCIKRFRTRAVL
jgi:hypothetical protein